MDEKPASPCDEEGGGLAGALAAALQLREKQIQGKFFLIFLPETKRNFMFEMILLVDH